MLGVTDLYFAEPKKWDAASDDAMVASRHCADLAATARDDVAATLKRCWVDETGQAARRKFIKQADQLEIAADTLRALAKAYTKLANKMTAAQRDLLSAADYANKYELTISEMGKVTASTPDPPDDIDEKIDHVQPLVNEALKDAREADTEAAASFRTIKGLTRIDDPDMARKALSSKSNPLAIALRISSSTHDLHPININKKLRDFVESVVLETGISRTLLLATLWQEQQWYQNYDNKQRGPFTVFGRYFNWMLREAKILPDKSLGITHVKLDTARYVMQANRKEFTTQDGVFLGDLNDWKLVKYIEANPAENIRLSAYYYRELQQNPRGVNTDKQLFMIYAAETDQVRDASEDYGDSTKDRGGAIKRRAEAWDSLQGAIDDADAWEALTDKQQKEAFEQLKSQAPDRHHVSIDPLFGGPLQGPGTGPPQPGTPTPSPGPSPTPPGG